jgi:hypothetical protein
MPTMRASMSRRVTAALSPVALAVASGAATVTPAAAASPVPVRWQFAPDFRSHPSRNPFASYLGGAPVWSLRASGSLAHDGDYAKLSGFASSFGSPGIRAWHAGTPGCVPLPAVGVNTNTRSAALCNARVPAHAAFARPAPNRMAVVAWTSPFNGTVTISHDAIADVDGSCGDGVTYSVDLGMRRLLTTALRNKDAKTLPALTQRVRKGSSLYFIVDPGPGHDAGCDTTQLQITVDRVS